ncbi:MAG TPA: hypothetical protein VGW10_06755, partial [Solirubrobacteraceae bacterium]|nr:hypothetical protein [Solirubrobacteraceae bacterium]
MRRLSVLLTVALAALTVAVPADAAKRRAPFKKQLSTFRSCAGLTAFAERRVDAFGSDVFAPRRMIGMGGLAASPPARRGSEGAPAPQATADAS